MVIAVVDTSTGISRGFNDSRLEREGLGVGLARLKARTGLV